MTCLVSVAGAAGSTTSDVPVSDGASDRAIATAPFDPRLPGEKMMSAPYMRSSSTRSGVADSGITTDTG